MRRTGESTVCSMSGNAAASVNFLTASHKVSAHIKQSMLLCNTVEFAEHATVLHANGVHIIGMSSQG